MYTKAIFLALAASAFASPEFKKRQAASGIDQASVDSVLATALPTTLLQQALTDPVGASAEIASQFAAGQTPEWFQNLPTEVQTYLVPSLAAGQSPTPGNTVTDTLPTDGPSPQSVSAALVAALPSELLAQISTDPEGASEEINSQFANGATPSWFSNLPSDVQTYLVPVDATAILTSENSASTSDVASTTTTDTVTSTSTSTSGTVSTSTTGTTSTSTASTTTSTSTTRTSSASSSSSSGSSTSEGGAAIPTALYGMGLAGAIGLVGLLAL